MNCLIVDDEPIAREVLITHLSKLSNITIVAQCSSALEAFDKINEVSIDLIFLDINMPELSGLSFVRSLPKDIKVIFTTAYREYAIDGFELDAVDYLLKPISFERLLQAVSRYYKLEPREKIAWSGDTTQLEDHIIVRSERKMIRVMLDEVYYLESLSDYIKIHTTKNVLVTRENISQIEKELPFKSFIRIHRSYIVAINKIEAFTHEYIEISGRQLPISRSYKTSVLKKLRGK